MLHEVKTLKLSDIRSKKGDFDIDREKIFFSLLLYLILSLFVCPYGNGEYNFFKLIKNSINDSEIGLFEIF